MEKLELLESILNSYPYPIVFVDNDYIIRYMNKNAKYHYYEERGYKDLIGKSLFDCHMNPHSVERIKAAWEGMKKNGKEVFISLTTRNQRIYMQGVRDYEGNWIGFIERFELNLQINHK
ncbi:MAG: PAS domain-containing protein [Lachnospiraceae bacterium]|nr:PAS domain-containing protein [Lachnospiraceae bacterium]